MYTVFPIGKNELDYLSATDPVLKGVIRRHGTISRTITPDVFVALAECIVSQQISGKAAQTIIGRLVERTGGLTPARIACCTLQELRACGVSARKAGYLQSAAQAASEGRLSAERFAKMDDEAIICELDALPGIGRWTAEMLLIFSLGRPDVLSYDDLIIRRAILDLYGAPIWDRDLYERCRARWSPYCSVASLYLWEHGNGMMGK